MIPIRQAAILVAVIALSSCTQDPINEVTVRNTTSIDQTIPEEPEKERKPIMLQAIKSYPAYIVTCGTIWGIPSHTQGEGHKERLVVKTEQGAEVSHSELLFFTLDGVKYIRHTYTEYTPPTEAALAKNPDAMGKTVECVDHFKQVGDALSLTDDFPEPPVATRKTHDSATWLVNTAVIDRAEVSELYNRSPLCLLPGENPGAKGKREAVRQCITEAIELDNGILIMAENGAEFCRTDRNSMNRVSEPGRLWK